MTGRAVHTTVKAIGPSTFRHLGLVQCDAAHFRRIPQAYSDRRHLLPGKAVNDDGVRWVAANEV